MLLIMLLALAGLVFVGVCAGLLKHAITVLTKLVQLFSDMLRWRVRRVQAKVIGVRQFCVGCGAIVPSTFCSGCGLRALAASTAVEAASLSSSRGRRGAFNAPESRNPIAERVAHSCKV